MKEESTKLRKDHNDKITKGEEYIDKIQKEKETSKTKWVSQEWSRRKKGKGCVHNQSKSDIRSDSWQARMQQEEHCRVKHQTKMNTYVLKARDTERDKVRDLLHKAKEDSEPWKELFEAKKRGHVYTDNRLQSAELNMDEGHDQARLPERHEVTHQRLMGDNAQLGYDMKRVEDEKKGLLRLYEELKKSYNAANDGCDQ